MKKLLIILSLYLSVYTATWTIAGQGGMKRTDSQGAVTSIIQATLPKPLARLDNLSLGSQVSKNGRDDSKVAKIKKMELELIGEGYISVGGGCLAYLTGKIIFKPEGEPVAVTIDNSGGYFGVRTNDHPIREFKIILPAYKIEPFFIKLKALLAHPIKAKMWSTRNAEVHISLPFKTEKLEALWREIDGKFAMDPLLKEIEKFVMECYKNPDKVL